MSTWRPTTHNLFSFFCRPSNHSDVIPQTKGAIAGSASRLEGHIKKVVLEHVAIALFVLSALIAFLWIWICCRKSRKRMSTIAPVTTTGTSVARPWWKMEDIYSSNAGPSQLWRKEENDSSNAGPSIPDNITNDRHVSSSPGISANDEGGSSTNGSFLHNINLFSTSDGDIESKFSLADHLPWKREVMPGSLNKRQKYDIAIPEIGSARFVGAGGGMDTVVEEGGNSGVPSRNINGSEIQSNSVDHAWVWWSDVMNYVSHWTQHEETPSQG